MVAVHHLLLVDEVFRLGFSAKSSLGLAIWHNDVFYRFDRKYDDSSAPFMAPVQFRYAGLGSHKAIFGEPGWCSSTCKGPISFDGPRQYISPSVAALIAFSFSSSWGKLKNNFSVPTQPPARVSNHFTSTHDIREG